MKLPRLNWGIYEQDIVFLGGTVQYSGYIVSKKWRSYVEEATVQIGNASCNVLMERFQDGSAVILHFVKQGLIYSRELYPEANAFWFQFHSLAEDSTQYLSFDMMRKCKQYITCFLQIVCIVLFGYGFVQCVSGNVSLLILILLCSSFLLFILLGYFYTWYHTSRIEDHPVK